MRPDAFLLAHGLDPGPTQRPTLAGFLVGALATAPALPILFLLRSIEAEARILDLSVPAAIAAGVIAMAAAGAVYGRMLGRAANDRRGGWLFGMAYGFLVWTGGAVMVLPILSGGDALGGNPAVGILLALLVWGTALGGLFPIVHRGLHSSVDRLKEGSIGEAAAAGSVPPGGLERRVRGRGPPD
jgi:hypothetical protein